MAYDKQSSPLELGLYAHEVAEPRMTAIEIIAIALSLVWLAGVAMFFWSTSGTGTASSLEWAMTVMAIVMPIALIWVAASTARTAKIMREEAARLQSSIDAMRAAYVEQQQRAASEIKPSVAAKLDEIAASQKAAETQMATFTSLRAQQTAERAAVVQPKPTPDAPQPTLALTSDNPIEKEPISVADFIKALNFPENEHDKEGFRTLRRALEDRSTQRLIRASQDALTLLSEDGIYMDDLRPDRARPEIWRKFATGERGRAIAALGGIHDRSSLVLTAGRMKQDPVFRDAAHHFLRHFDKTFMKFESHASDEEISHLADTRTARAFMLLGRVAGTFD